MALGSLYASRHFSAGILDTLGSLPYSNHMDPSSSVFYHLSPCL